MIFYSCSLQILKFTPTVEPIFIEDKLLRSPRLLTCLKNIVEADKTAS